MAWYDDTGRSHRTTQKQTIAWYDDTGWSHRTTQQQWHDTMTQAGHTGPHNYNGMIRWLRLVTQDHTTTMAWYDDTGWSHRTTQQQTIAWYDDTGWSHRTTQQQWHDTMTNACVTGPRQGAGVSVEGLRQPRRPVVRGQAGHSQATRQGGLPGRGVSNSLFAWLVRLLSQGGLPGRGVSNSLLLGWSDCSARAGYQVGVSLTVCCLVGQTAQPGRATR